MWVDYLNPDARQWWSDKFAPKHFPGFDGIVDIWNDMNEPSVFNGPEVTAPRDLKVRHPFPPLPHSFIHITIDLNVFFVQSLSITEV